MVLRNHVFQPPRRSIHGRAFAWGFAVLAACGSERPEENGAASQPVVGGTPVSGECAWPSTVQVDAATSCTGTLIHSRIVTTAAHCLRAGGGSARITFGRGPARFNVTAPCKAGATGSSGVSTGRDWAYCVLPDDPRIRELPTIPPLVGCEADVFLKAGSNAWIVGFGSTGASAGGFGVLRQVEVKINRATASVIDVGDAQRGACHGDSGGPLYLQLLHGDRDYGWRLAGATSGPGGPCDCACSTAYVNIGRHVEAIEANERIDVTPCTDATGAWSPDPDCTAMQRDPASAMGSFPNCVVTRTTTPIESCGPNGAAGGAGGSFSSGGTTSFGGGGSSSVAGSSSTGGQGGFGVGGNTVAGGGGAPLTAGTTSAPTAGMSSSSAGDASTGGMPSIGGAAFGGVSGAGAGGNVIANPSGGHGGIHQVSGTGGQEARTGALGAHSGNSGTAPVGSTADDPGGGTAARTTRAPHHGGDAACGYALVDRTRRSRPHLPLSTALLLALARYRRRRRTRRCLAGMVDRR